MSCILSKPGYNVGEHQVNVGLFRHLHLMTQAWEQAQAISLSQVGILLPRPPLLTRPSTSTKELSPGMSSPSFLTHPHAPSTP